MVKQPKVALMTFDEKVFSIIPKESVQRIKLQKNVVRKFYLLKKLSLISVFYCSRNVFSIGLLG